MKFLVKFLKTPCDKCITQATCQNRTWMWKSRECSMYDKYYKKKTKVEGIGFMFFDNTMALLMLVGIILIIVTFGFGVKVWWDIGVDLFEWLFF